MNGRPLLLAIWFATTILFILSWRAWFSNDQAGVFAFSVLGVLVTLWGIAVAERIRKEEKHP